MKSAAPQISAELKKKYLQVAIDEYEFSQASEYEKPHMSRRATTGGTLDFEYHDAESDVKLSRDGADGAWVNARVWVPREWLDSHRPVKAGGKRRLEREKARAD